MPEYISPQQLQVMLEQARGQIRGRGPGAAIQQRQNNQRMNQLQQAIQGNQRLQSGEMNSLIQSARQGGLQGPGNPSFQFQTPGAQEAYLEQLQGRQKHQQAMQMQGLRNQGTGNRAFSGDPIFDEKNNFVGYAQANQAGAPTYWINGEAKRVLPVGHQVVPSGALAEMMPTVLGTATPQQASTAGAIEGAEQAQMTIGAGARGQQAADLEVAQVGRMARAEHQAQLELDINRRTEQLDEAGQKHNLMEGWIDKAIDNASFWTTGFFGTALEFIPGTAAFDLVATVDSIKANVGFDKLQQMRDASPTGGALGQVSEFENRLLQATVGNLENSQSREQFVANLEQLKYQLDAIVNRGISSMERDYGAANTSRFTIEEVN